MRKMKVVTSLFLSFVLIMTMFVQNSLADVSFNGDSGESFTTSSGNTTKPTRMTASAGGKISDDAYYQFGVACTSWNSNVYMQAKSNILELQFLLTDDNAQLNIYPRNYKNSTQSKEYTAYTHFEVNSTGMSWIGGTSSGYKATERWTVNRSISVGEWHTLVIHYIDGCASDGMQKGSYYIDGELIKDNDSSVALYGYYQVGIGPKSNEHPVLLDNIHNWYGRTGADSSSNVADIQKRTPSLIIDAEDGYEINNSNKIISVPNATTVAQLLSSIKTTDGADDVKRVYTDSSMSSIAEDDASAVGTTLIIAAKNGTDTEQAYSYYKVEETAPVDPDADVLKGADASDLTVAANTGYAEGGTDAEIILESGVFGKTSDDSAYKFTRTNNKAYINYNCIHKSDTNSLFEFGFAKSDAEDNFRLEMNYYSNDEQSSRVSLTMYFKDGGLQWGDSNTNLYAQPFKTGRWYTVAVQFPTNGEKQVPVYVNGSLAFTGEIADGAYGLAYARFKNSTNKTFYLDNIRAAEEVYAPSKDAKASITVENAIVRGDELQLLFNDESKTTIVVGANDSLRMYKSDWSTASTISEADFIVAAAKNDRYIERTYTYLDKKVVSAFAYYSKEVIEDATSLNAKLMSKEGDAILIVVWYEDGKFVDLKTAEAELNGDIYTAENKINNLNADYTYRIFVWNSVDGLYPLTKAINVK